jgi:[methyl-Co(III) methanol-specific corrinoid protein]:coenzyme M methyltransferase
MNQKERLLRALNMESVDRPPAAVPTQPAIVEVMERSGYAWPAAQKNAKDMAGLAWACHEIGGIESVRVPFDINIEAEAMGCETRFGDDMITPPMTTPKTKDEYDEIKIPDPARDGRMPVVLEAIALLKERTGGEVPLIAAFGTPFELMATTMNYEDITLLIHEDPDYLARQMEEMTEITMRYGREIEKAGPDVLFLADGTSQTLGPKYYARFSFPYTRKLIESLSRPTILHICSDATPLIEQMVETGVSALSIDKPVDINRAVNFTKGRVSLVGRIPQQTLCFGTPEEVISETGDSRKDGMDVIAPGCGILPQTPLENLRAYVERITGG